MATGAVYGVLGVVFVFVFFVPLHSSSYFSSAAASPFARDLNFVEALSRRRFRLRSLVIVFSSPEASSFGAWNER